MGLRTPSRLGLQPLRPHTTTALICRDHGSWPPTLRFRSPDSLPTALPARAWPRSLGPLGHSPVSEIVSTRDTASCGQRGLCRPSHEEGPDTCPAAHT